MGTNQDGEYRRGTGFEQPFDKLQMLAWVLCLFLILSFYLIVVPLHDDTTKVWTSLVYAALLSAFVHLAIRTGGVDPVDKTTLERLQQTPRNIPSSELLYCCFCKCKVHRRSKHCGLCNKCVGDFDHHCKWLNNCVGGTNYKSFFRLINVGVLFTSFQCGCAVTAFVSVWRDPGYPMSSPAGSYFTGVDRTGLLVALGFSIGIPILVAGMLVHLILFHLYLQHKKMSTYDYILAQRAKKSASQGKPPPASRSREKVTPEITETRMDEANEGAPPPERVSGRLMGDASAHDVAGGTAQSARGVSDAGGVFKGSASESMAPDVVTGKGPAQESVQQSGHETASRSHVPTDRPQGPPGAAPAQVHVSELVPESGYLPGETAHDSGVGKKKSLLKPLPPLSAPVAAARRVSGDVS
jgi:hypothetical protein